MNNIVVIDFRKKNEFLEGHIPNAINISPKEVQDTSASIVGLKLKKQSVEKLLQLKGIDSGVTIIIYDAKMEVDAARLWWIFKINGADSIKLLNGGLHQYLESGGKLVTEVTQRKIGDFTFVGDGLGMEAKRKLVQSVIGKLDWTIVDARSDAEYNGEILSKNCNKKGRIPGSVSLDWSYSVNYHSDQKFKSAKQLQDLFNSKEIIKVNQVIAYCRSGVRSAHTTFVLTELLGYKNVYNYDGSWLEWSSIENLPIETK